MEQREENPPFLNRNISPFHCHLLGTDFLSRLPWDPVLVGMAGGDSAFACDRISQSRSALGARPESVADGRASCSVKQSIMQLKTGDKAWGQSLRSHCPPVCVEWRTASAPVGICQFRCQTLVAHLHTRHSHTTELWYPSFSALVSPAPSLGCLKGCFTSHVLS